MKIIIFILFLLIISNIGFSKSFTIDQIDISAEVLENGNIQITESRTYTFKGSYTWADYQLPLDKLKEVKLISLREGSQNYYQSHDESPGSYYTENQDSSFYVKWFYEAEDQTRTFVLKYLVTDAVTVYDDVAELYYKFIGKSNPKDIGFVDVNIKLPKFASQDSVRIWLHAPVSGLINISEGIINLSINPLPAENYFETRIVFPPSWVEYSQNKILHDKLDQIITEETLWAEEADKTRIKVQEELKTKKVKEEEALPVAVVLSIVCVLFVFWLFNKYGKSFNVPYNLKVDSAIPIKIHPTILSCLYFNKRVYGIAISTTIFELARRDILAIEQIQPKDKKWWQPKIQYIFKLNRVGWNEIRSQMKDFENDMLDFFFNNIGKGEDNINILIFKKSSSKMRKWFKIWTKLLKTQCKHIPLYDKKSVKVTSFAAIFSAFVIAGGILILILIGYPGIFILASGLIDLIISFFILRYTEDMKLKRKKWKALRNYLKKYYFINETGLSCQSQIGKYFVYGLALGVGKTAIEKMIKTVPADRHNSYFPWYIYSHSAQKSPADFAHAITSIVTAAFSTVSSAAGAGGVAGSGGGGAG